LFIHGWCDLAVAKHCLGGGTEDTQHHLQRVGGRMMFKDDVDDKDEKL
jgi:hypothetical protein